MDADLLARELAQEAQRQPDGVSFRRAAVALVRAAVPCAVAAFHAFSPRVPLERGVWVGMDPSQLRVDRWDRVAVDLAPLFDHAVGHGGVVADTEVVGRTGDLRRRYRAALQEPLGVRHVALVHLVVRGRVRAVLMLGRERGPFTPEELALMRAIAPTLAVADAAQQLLDEAPSATLPTEPRCVDGRLTARQRQIVELVARGLTNAQIGQALALSPHTVRNRLADVFHRLGVGSRAEVVRVAVLR